MEDNEKVQETIKDALLYIFKNKLYLGEREIEYSFSSKVQKICRQRCTEIISPYRVVSAHTIHIRNKETKENIARDLDFANENEYYFYIYRSGIILSANKQSTANFISSSNSDEALYCIVSVARSVNVIFIYLPSDKEKKEYKVSILDIQEIENFSIEQQYHMIDDGENL